MCVDIYKGTGLTIIIITKSPHTMRIFIFVLFFSGNIKKIFTLPKEIPKFYQRWFINYRYVQKLDSKYLMYMLVQAVKR